MNLKLIGVLKLWLWDKLLKFMWVEWCVVNEYCMKFVKVCILWGFCDFIFGFIGVRNVCGKCFGFG